MGDGIVAAVALVSSVAFSVLGGALSGFHRGRLQESFRARGDTARLKSYLKALPQYKLAVWTLDAIADAVVVILIVILNLPYQEALGSFFFPALLGESVVLVAFFGEVIPRSWGSRNADAVLGVGLPLAHFLSNAVYPLTALLRFFDKGFARVVGRRPGIDRSYLLTDLREKAREAEKEGVLHEDETEMIESVLSFRDASAEDIMTPRTDMVMMPVESSPEEVVKLIAEGGPSRIPIFEETRDGVVGVLYARDILVAKMKAESPRLHDLMRKPFFVPETKKCVELLREFRANKVHIAIVLDEYGGTAGLVTTEDVLEEIVGEIHDEYDKKQAELMTRLDNLTLEVDGKVHIDDINQEMNLNLPEDDDFETIAGFLFSAMGKVPLIGESYESPVARFKVLDADDRRINRVRIELLEADKSEKAASG